MNAEKRFGKISPAPGMIREKLAAICKIGDVTALSGAVIALIGAVSASNGFGRFGGFGGAKNGALP